MRKGLVSERKEKKNYKGKRWNVTINTGKEAGSEGRGETEERYEGKYEGSMARVLGQWHRY